MIKRVATHPEVQLLPCYVLHSNTFNTLDSSRWWTELQFGARCARVDQPVFRLSLSSCSAPPVGLDGQWKRCYLFFSTLHMLLWIYVAVVLKMIVSRSLFSAGIFFLSILFHSFIAFSFWENFSCSHVFILNSSQTIFDWSDSVIDTFIKDHCLKYSQLHFRIFRIFPSCIKVLSCPSFLMCQCLYISILIIYLTSLLHVGRHYRS